MAVTQYIGARYVPLFADPIEWSSATAYEPLTIVTHQGNSYTSRQYVPVGIDITNDEYWASTGNYNAQIEQYRQEVQAFNGRITANTTAIGNEVDARTAAVTAEAEARAAADTSLQTQIDETMVQTVVDAWCKGYWNVGNSYETQQFNLFKIGEQNIMLDVGWNAPADEIRAFFTARGVTKLDYIFISHYHPDHVDNLDYICSILDVSECTLILPKVTASNLAAIADVGGTWSATWLSNQLAMVQAVVNQHNLTVVYPYEGQEFTFANGVKLKVYNANHDVYYTHRPYDYNNCSLCAYVYSDDTSIWFAADIAEYAQRMLTNSVPHANIAYMAHHGYNDFINMDYYLALKPDAYIAANGRGRSGSASYDNHYLERNGKENFLAIRDGIPVYATSNNDNYTVHFSMTQQAVKVEARSFNRKKAGMGYNCLRDVLNTDDAATLYAAEFEDVVTAMNGNDKAMFNVIGGSSFAMSPYWGRSTFEFNTSNSHTFTNQWAAYTESPLLFANAMCIEDSPFSTEQNSAEYRIPNDTAMLKAVGTGITPKTMRRPSLSHMNGINFFELNQTGIALPTSGNIPFAGETPSGASHEYFTYQFGDDLYLNNGHITARWTMILEVSLDVTVTTVGGADKQLDIAIGTGASSNPVIRLRNIATNSPANNLTFHTQRIITLTAGQSLYLFTSGSDEGMIANIVSTFKVMGYHPKIDSDNFFEGF